MTLVPDQAGGSMLSQIELARRSASDLIAIQRNSFGRFSFVLNLDMNPVRPFA